MVQPPNPAPVNRAPMTPGVARRDVDQRVELRAADLVQVAQRVVARVEQPAHRVQVARLERVDRRQDPRVLLHDVLGASGGHVVQAVADRRQQRGRHVAQGRAPTVRSRRSTRRRPRTVNGARCRRTSRACAAEPEWQATSATSSSGSGIARCSSDRQSSSSARAGLAEDRRELVHDPVVEADVPVLRALDDVDEVHRVDRRRIAARERPRRRRPRSRPTTTARRPGAGRTRAGRGSPAGPRRPPPAPRPCRRRSRATCPAAGRRPSTAKRARLPRRRERELDRAVVGRARGRWRSRGRSRPAARSPRCSRCARRSG